MSNKARYRAILAIVVMAYFVAYPEDVQSITMPLATLLNLTMLVSPWLYAVVAVAIFSAALVKTWGGRNQAGPESAR